MTLALLAAFAVRFAWNVLVLLVVLMFYFLQSNTGGNFSSVVCVSVWKMWIDVSEEHGSSSCVNRLAMQDDSEDSYVAPQTSESSS